MADGTYFSSDMLAGCLGKTGMEQLESMTINSGTAFLSGQITNATYKVTKSNPVSALTKTTAAGLGTYAIGKELYENREEILSTLATTIISKSIEIISKEITKLSTQYLAYHMQYATGFPNKVTSYALDYFNENKMSVGDVLKALNETAESRAEKIKNEDNKKNLSSFISNMNDKSSQFISKLNSWVDTGSSYISMVTSYIENGPEWVTNQLDKQIKSLLEDVNSAIDKQWQKDKEAYDSKAQSLGEKLGQEMTEKYNDALQKAQKKGIEKINKTKTKASLKLCSSKAKAASLIASKTGIYIPI